MVATLEDCAIVASLVLSGVAQGAVVAVLAIATDALNYAPVTGGLKTAAVLAGSALILCYMAVVRHWLSATEGDGFERWHGWRNFALVFTATVTASLFSMLDNAHPPISADGRSISPRDGLDASFCNWCAVPRILAGLVVLTLMVFSWATTTARADRDRTKRPGGAAASCGGWRAVQLALACAQLLFGAGLASAFDSPSCYTLALDAAWNCVKEDAALAYAWRMCCLSGDDQLQPTARCVEMRAVLLDARDEFHIELHFRGAGSVSRPHQEPQLDPGDRPAGPRHVGFRHERLRRDILQPRRWAAALPCGALRRRLLCGRLR